jgi:hypothetical protein
MTSSATAGMAAERTSMSNRAILVFTCQSVVTIGSLGKVANICR